MIDLTAHFVSKISARFRNNSGSEWIDIKIHTPQGDIEWTLFSQQKDGKLKKLAEAIKELWPQFQDPLLDPIEKIRQQAELDDEIPF